MFGALELCHKDIGDLLPKVFVERFGLVSLNEIKLR